MSNPKQWSFEYLEDAKNFVRSEFEEYCLQDEIEIEDDEDFYNPNFGDYELRIVECSFVEAIRGSQVNYCYCDANGVGEDLFYDDHDDSHEVEFL